MYWGALHRITPLLSGEFVFVMTSSTPEFGVLPESFSTETCTTRLLTIKPLQSKNCTFTGSVLPHLKMLGSWLPCVQLTGCRMPVEV